MKDWIIKLTEPAACSEKNKTKYLSERLKAYMDFLLTERTELMILGFEDSKGVKKIVKS